MLYADNHFTILLAFLRFANSLTLNHDKDLRLPLAPNATFQGRFAIRRILGGKVPLVEFDGIAQLVFPVPLAHYASELVEHLPNWLITLMPELPLQFCC